MTWPVHPLFWQFASSLSEGAHPSDPTVPLPHLGPQSTLKDKSTSILPYPVLIFPLVGNQKNKKKWIE